MMGPLRVSCYVRLVPKPSGSDNRVNTGADAEVRDQPGRNGAYAEPQNARIDEEGDFLCIY